MRLSQTVVQRSDKFNDVSRQLDPLPSLRDHCIQQSNAHIHGYMRAVRTIVYQLEDSLLETEAEIKSLLGAKENLEKSLEHIRKDILLNHQSSMRRRARPLRERKTDGADDLLDEEKDQLLKLKGILESKLRSVQKQLQVLDNARKRLKAVATERSRVIDLMCHTVSSAFARSQYRIKVEKSNAEHPGTPQGNPVGASTPEVSQAMSLSRDARQRSAILRNDVIEAIDQTRKIQKVAHRSVNLGLTKKISETMTMKQHLQLTSGEIRVAKNRGGRWHYATDIARGYTMGPVASSDLTTRERLNRPNVAIFQRHPGTQLPESEEIIRGNEGLKDSLDAIGRNISLLKLTQNRLKDDISDKREGANIDSSAVRLRKRNSNHRWVIGGVGC